MPPLDRGRRLAPPVNAPLMSPDREQHSQAWTEYHQDTADALARLPGQVLTQARQGVADGSDAVAGDVGEYLTASRAVGAPLALGTGTPADVVSLPLTAGDWEAWGTVGFVPAGGTVVRSVEAWVNTVAATQPADGMLQLIQFSATGAPAGGTQILLAPPRRISLAAAGTAHLSAIAGFTTSTLGAYGAIVARRVR